VSVWRVGFSAAAEGGEDCVGAGGQEVQGQATAEGVGIGQGGLHFVADDERAVGRGDQAGERELPGRRFYRQRRHRGLAAALDVTQERAFCGHGPARRGVIQGRDEFGQPYRVAQLGVVRAGREFTRLGPVAAAGAAVDETWTITKLIPQVIGQIISGERSTRELGGPLKIGQMSGQRAAMGLPELVAFMALVSINLGFMNLLPIPVLDGGHLALYAVEAVRRRPLGARAQELAFVSGFAALVSFMLFVTWNDLASFGVWEQLTRLVG